MTIDYKICLKVDGMLSGTGIRDAVNGGYIEPEYLGVSGVLTKALLKWLAEYAEAHYQQFTNDEANRQLDVEGLEIARRLQQELPDAKVSYYSSAYLHDIEISARC